jgi:putative copper resistance protein D
LASWPRHLIVAVLAALALASLAWSGHAAASDGWVGSFHRLNDAVHLLAAAIWIGAIAGFALVAWRPGRSANAGGLPALAQALRNFAPLGTVLVLLVAVTGVVNLALISGWPALLEVWRSDYGRMLIAKIGLFFAMLVAAGLHRWYLAHALETAIAEDTPARNTLTHLRLSLAAELLLSVAILLLVARLGMMAP